MAGDGRAGAGRGLLAGGRGVRPGQARGRGRRVLGGGASLLTPFPLGPVLLEVGPDLGAAYVSQRLQVANGGTATSPDFSASGVAMATFRTGGFRLGFDLLDFFRPPPEPCGRPDRCPEL